MFTWTHPEKYSPFSSTPFHSQIKIAEVHFKIVAVQINKGEGPFKITDLQFKIIDLQFKIFYVVETFLSHKFALLC